MSLLNLAFLVFLNCVAIRVSRSENVSEKCLNTFSNPVDISDCNITMLDPLFIAHNHHITSLDMSFNQMFDFPSDGSPFLFHSNLRHYYCKFCGITTIYEMTFSKLNQLELLNLRDNQIKAIPVTAFNYNRINYLYLVKNQIHTFNERNELETMQHLVKLDLSENEAFQLYNLTLDFSALERVICQKCGLSFLSQNWFEQVKRLKKLNLENNLIREVPKLCFSKNHKLQYINLSDNPIMFIDIVNDHLEFFICNGCAFDNLSENMFNGMPNLRYLELNRNQITNVKPSTFSSNKLLSHLSLERNNLVSFPFKVLRTSQSLESLCLDYNPFHPHEEMSWLNLYKAMKLRKQCSVRDNPLYHFENFLPNDAPDGTILYTRDFPACQEAFNISSQNIVFIHPMAYENCFSLRILQMDYNMKYRFPEHRPFLHSKFLESYSCNHCAIAAVYPETFNKLPNLKSIILKNNKLENITSLNIFTSLEHLQLIDLSHNQLKLLPVELLASHKRLATIYLNNNQELWHKWHLPIFEQSSVTTLHASNCKLGHITQATFSLMPLLEELDISKNPIETIHSRAFAKQSRLRILHVEFTRLKAVPIEAIEPLVQLKRFCLHGLDGFEIWNDQFNGSIAKLGALMLERKLYCAKDDRFFERLTSLNITAHERSENGSAKPGRGEALLGVIVSYLISRLDIFGK